MKINRSLIIILICLFSGLASAQLKTLRGKVIANEEVEGIHILNKTALKYTVTNTDGSFEILAKIADSLVISSLKYKRKTIVITKSMVDLGFLEVALDERVTELDEVVLGRILTGNLSSDLKNTETKDGLNFYNLGIPGYTGKLPTLAERTLLADILPGGGRSLEGLINDINGQTKYFKEIERLEKKIICIKKFNDVFSKTLFENRQLADSLKVQYFDYASDDPRFNDICRNKSALNQLEFLIQKLKDFKIQIKSNNED